MPRKRKGDSAPVPNAVEAAPEASTELSDMPLANELTDADKAFLDWLAEAAVRLYFADTEQEH